MNKFRYCPTAIIGLSFLIAIDKLCFFRHFLPAVGWQWPLADEEAIGLSEGGAGAAGRRVRVALVQLQ